MGIKAKPVGTYTLVWSGDDAIADHVAAGIAKRTYWRERDAAVFDKNTIKPGGELLRFTVEHLTRGALEYVDTFLTANNRKVAAFRCAVVSMSGPGAVKVERTSAGWDGKVISEECMDEIVRTFPADALYEIGGMVLANAVLGPAEKKVSSPPSGVPGTE